MPQSVRPSFRRLPASAALALFVAALLCSCAPVCRYSIAGLVVDSRADPVAGAKAAVLSEGRKTLGSATTDAGGKFEIAVQSRRKAELSLRVEALGFEDWERWYKAASDRGLKVTLDRRVDRAFLEELLANRDAEARSQRVRYLLAAKVRPSNETVFPYLGALREDLRKVVQAAAAEETNDDKLAQPARALLALWGDPEDRQLVESWLEKNPWFGRPHPDVEGKTLAEACAAWTVAHFTAEGVRKPWTWHYCHPPTIDPTGSRALVEFEVRYEHWEYSIYLVFHREEGIWKLRTVFDGRIT